MDLPTLSNAPREFPLGGAFFRARALTLADLGEVLAWLSERIPPEDDGVVRLSAEASRLALATTEGLAVVLHLSLLSCHPTMTRANARALAATMTPDDASRLHAIAFRRRPSYEPDDGRPAQDLAELDWGPIVEALAQHRAWEYEAVLGLTLDQYDNVVARGELRGPDDLDVRDVQRMWEEAQGASDAAPVAAKPIPETLP